MTAHILAGDIGGTKADLALFNVKDNNFQPIFEKVFDTGAVSSATELLDHFLKEAPSLEISSACLGFAGPVLHGKGKGANLKWDLDRQVLQKALSLNNLSIINDLAALAYAVPYLEKHQLVQLKKGTATNGSIGLLAAGTGLGEAFLCRQDGKSIPCPSEGGHKDFCPRTEEEFRLLQFLQKKYGHVSAERVLSGAGIIDIFLFLLQEEQMPVPEWLPLEDIHKNAALVSARASEQNDRISVKTLQLFCSLYGAEAGNIALQYLATGGVYIGGGIGPKIEPFLNSDSFRKSFTGKGRMQELLEEIPVFLINDNKGTLLGAARYAGAFLAEQKT